jgi:serine kinase of HPr protein (carbohydrate metabolism regulator)
LASESTLVHASCIAFGENAVLIIGPPGSGKSDLALRLIHGSPPAELVSDDQTLISRKGERLIASAPADIAGKLEVRGFGIADVPFRSEASIKLAVLLRPSSEIERMPPEGGGSYQMLGLSVPAIEIDARSASAAARLRLALDHFARKRP